LNGITCLPIFMNVYHSVQKLLVGDRQTGDLISLLSFLESRLKNIGHKFFPELPVEPKYINPLKAGSETCHDSRSVSRSVFVSSPFWDSWLDSNLFL
jgi:hypothetical protein